MSLPQQYHITIDQGNTAAKVAVFRADAAVDDPAGLVHVECHRRGLTPQDVSALAERFPPAGALYCSVCGDDPAVVGALRRACPGAEALSADTPLPVDIAGGYDTPSTLGHDRIADLAGARVVAPGRWALVVDIGTAITYDVLDPRGAFRGGNIAPGVYMRLRALNKFTARLPLVDPAGVTQVPDWGRDTPGALLSGAINGVLAEIGHYRGLLPPGATVILTGGAVDLVAPHAPFPVVVEDHLVPIGLNSILHHIRDLKG